MELTYLFLIPAFFIYWCVNEKVGIQLGMVVLLSIWANSIIKELNIQLPIHIEFGWIIIAVVFCGYIFLRKTIETLLSMGGLRAYIITSAVVSFIMILYCPSFEFVLPGGSFLGLSVGYCLNKRYVGFKTSDVLQRKGLIKFLTLFARFLLGIAVLAAIMFRVESIIERIAERQNIKLYIFLCYALISLWVSFVAPWIFIKLRLAGISNSDTTEQKQ
ncbi:MAG: hypothetical protein LBI28_00540 [Treponema sp.]|jgi:hypothetical protein|nr:hypothetical protein [Treponema sp.]